MVCSNDGCDPNKLVRDHNRIMNGSLWKHIRGIVGGRNDINEVISRGLRKVVGEGSSILFQEDT